jgi:hypothetical protein
MFECFYHIDILRLIGVSAGWPFNPEITLQGILFGLGVAIKALGNVGYHDAVPWMTSGTMLISAAYEMS